MHKETFGARLRAARKAKELSGERLGLVLGVSKQTVSHWENDLHQPDLGQLAALCRALGVSADSLVLGESSAILDKLATLERLQRELRDAVGGASQNVSEPTPDSGLRNNGDKNGPQPRPRKQYQPPGTTKRRRDAA